MTGDLWLERVAPGPEREVHLPLLLLADEPQPLHGYLQLGDLYVLRGKRATARSDPCPAV
jgi:hypothetical protein